MNNDQSLIKKIKSNGANGLEEVYVELREEFIVWLMKSYSCNFEEAEEHFQFAILTLYENIVNGKLTTLSSTLKTYVFSIGRNKALDLIKAGRKWGPRLDVDPNVLIEEETSDFDVEDVNLDLAEESLSKLKGPCQTLLKLYYYHKRSMEEISSEMGYKNTSTTKNLKYKCLQRLRKIFNDLVVANYEN